MRYLHSVVRVCIGEVIIGLAPASARITVVSPRALNAQLDVIVEHPVVSGQRTWGPDLVAL